MSDDEKPSPSSGNTDSGTSVSWTITLAVALFFISVSTITVMPRDELEGYFLKEVQMVYGYVGEHETRELFVTGDEIGNWVLTHIPIERLHRGKMRNIPMVSKFFERLPFWIKWVCRRGLLVLSVLVLMLPLGFLWGSRAIFKRDGEDLMKDRNLVAFEIGRVLLYNGVAFVCLNPVATLPMYDAIKPYIFGISIIPLFIYIWKLRFDYLAPVLFVGSSLYLGPWGVLIGAFIFVCGLYVMMRQWPEAT